jgi:hypothetical protein
MLYPVIISLVAILVIRFAAKFLTKVIGLSLLIIGVSLFMYSKGLGPFKQNYLDLAALEDKYCFEQLDEDKCECIVKVLRDDLKGRFSEAELEEMREQRIKGAYVLKKSLDMQKDVIGFCLKKRGAPSKLKDFQTELLPFKKKHLQWMDAIFSFVVEETENRWKEIKEDKETLDERY